MSAWRSLSAACAPSTAACLSSRAAARTAPRPPSRSPKPRKARAVDALLTVTPYYNKASQSGLVQHFSAIADAVDIPVILYNVPSRTGVGCTAQTYQALAKHPNIAGVKEASDDFDLIQDTLNLCPLGFTVWSGNDGSTAAIMALGGKGVISVAQMSSRVKCTS